MSPELMKWIFYTTTSLLLAAVIGFIFNRIGKYFDEKDLNLKDNTKALKDLVTLINDITLEQTEKHAKQDAFNTQIQREMKTNTSEIKELKKISETHNLSIELLKQTKQTP